jgi:hypothetical protein
MREFKEGELSHPPITRFATTFLALQSLLNEYQALRRMFCSQQWLFWKDSTKQDATTVKVFLLGNSLWEKVTEIVRFTEPLVKVLLIIYEGMDRVKEAIKTFYKGNSSKYLSIWKFWILGGTSGYIHHCMQREHIIRVELILSSGV